MSNIVTHASGATIITGESTRIGPVSQELDGKFAIVTRYALELDGKDVFIVLATIDPLAVQGMLEDIDEEQLEVYGIRKRITKNVLSNICVALFDEHAFNKTTPGVEVSEPGIKLASELDADNLCDISAEGDDLNGLYAYITANGAVVMQHST